MFSAPSAFQAFDHISPASKTAQAKGPRRNFLTLYIQNIKLEGVNPPHYSTLYFPPNQQLKQKSSRWGS
jgi:hypothetical protein